MQTTPKVVMFLIFLLLPLVCSGANPTASKQSYLNKAGSVVARSYTNGQYTVYRDTRGNVLGYSKDNFNGVKVLDKNGSYKAIIVNGLIIDSKGQKIGKINKK